MISISIKNPEGLIRADAKFSTDIASLEMFAVFEHRKTGVLFRRVPGGVIVYRGIGGIAYAEFKTLNKEQQEVKKYIDPIFYFLPIYAAAIIAGIFLKNSVLPAAIVLLWFVTKDRLREFGFVWSRSSSKGIKVGPLFIKKINADAFGMKRDRIILGIAPKGAEIV